MFTEEELVLIRQAQAEQIANPTLAGVNTESSFVYNRLISVNVNLATRYWNHICRRTSFNDEVADNNQIKLKRIDDGFEMPAWGIWGT
jgi:hypothetical protein